MPKHTLESFLAAIPPNTPILALDVSAKRIGMAVTNPARTMALPAGTLTRSRWAKDVSELIAAIRERQVGGIVIGLPINMDGSNGPAAQSRLTFGSNLGRAMAEQRLEIPYVFVDERLTTHAARDLLEGRGGGQNAEDQIAACEMLKILLRLS